MSVIRWHDIGTPQASTVAHTTHALDSSTKGDGTHSNDQFALGFQAPSAKTLSEFMVYVSAVTGSPATTDITCALYAASNDWRITTGAAIETKDIGAIGTGWQTFSGFTTALTAGAKYFLVVRNKTATPASNFITIRLCGGAGGFVTPSIGNAGGFALYTTTSGIANLAVQSSNSYGYRIKWSDNSFVGFPVETSGVASGSGVGIYGSREYGNKFTYPIAVPIVGIQFALNSEVGNPSGIVRARLYQGTTLIATSYSILDDAASYNAGVQYAWFDNAYEIPANTAFRVAVGVGSGGDASNYHTLYQNTWHNNADSLALKRFDITDTYYDGSSWTDTATRLASVVPTIDISQMVASGGEHSCPFLGA